MPVEIMPFTAADITEALALWRRTEGLGLGGDTPEVLAVYLARNPRLSFVARDGGVLVGAVLCGHDGRRGYLHHLAVAADFRGRGLGRRLADHCLEALLAAGIDKCHLFVKTTNHSGQAFWQATGWLPRTDLVLMSKDILK
jgi:putative acetyltransferase